MMNPDNLDMMAKFILKSFQEGVAKFLKHVEGLEKDSEGFAEVDMSEIIMETFSAISRRITFGDDQFVSEEVQSFPPKVEKF